MDVAVLEAPEAVPDPGFVRASGLLANQIAAGRLLRFDLAWQLLLPSSISAETVDIPAGNPRTRMRPFLDWAREALSPKT